MKKLRLGLVLFGTVLLSVAFAQQLDARTVLYEAVYEVAEDATYTAQITEITELLTPTGVQDYAQTSRAYSTNMQDLELLEAYILKPDGTRVAVPEDNIFLNDLGEGSGAPMFDDYGEIEVIFPNAQVGDQVVAVWQERQLEPFFPGHFYLEDIVWYSSEVLENRVEIRAPESLGLSWAQRGDYEVTDAVEDGVQVIKAKAEQLEPETYEAGMVSGYDVSQVLVVSSFDSWKEIGEVYWERAEDKVMLTPEIEKLAEEVAGDLADAEAAEALYSWVTRNVRYVAIHIAEGGFVPHASEQILQNLYADCKDYVTLLQALLEAKGIDSEAVLVFSGSSYSTAPVPTPSQFNHAILYLPEHNLYLDPTSQYAPYGTLPESDLGKFVVHASATPRTAETPSGDAVRDTYALTSHMTLLPSGDLEGEATVSFSGSFEAQWRAVLADVPEASRPGFIQDFLSNYGEGGSGTLTFSDPGELGETFKVDSSWRSPQAVAMADFVTFPLPTGLNLYPLAALQGYIALESRQYPLEFIAAGGEWRYDLTLPEGYSVTRLPENASFENELGIFTASYELDGNVLKANRQLDVYQDLIAPEDYGGLQELFQTVLRDARAPIVLEAALSQSVDP